MTFQLGGDHFGMGKYNVSNAYRALLHFPFSQGGAGIDCQLMMLFQHDVALAVELIKAVRQGQVKHKHCS